MDIKVPSDLTFFNSIDFCNYLDEIEEHEDFVFDFSSLATVEPFGMLLVGAKVRQFMERFPESGYYDINYKHHSYAANMGFFKSMYQDYGHELHGSRSYVPITKLEVSKFHSDSRDNREHVVETVEREAGRLSQVLSNGDSELKKTLTYSLREIIRNSVEHSESDHVWLAAQFWPTKNRVEVAILDEGIGIRRSLRKNKKLKIKSQKDALLLSLEPGITRKTPTRFDEDDPYANSGFGLFMTSRICKDGGDFAICSGKRVLALNKRGNYFFDSSFSGTAIRMRLTVSRMSQLSEMLAKLIKEGERTSRKNKKNTIITASKVSSLLIEDAE
ncbi:MAG: hypothetical protein COA36_11390 [Desulfotalea sp.]|nr:MAG: hypothetical protein COA36_11390 [Desulfotalea sp.]